jgi:CheY-like chemotaxis protein
MTDEPMEILLVEDNQDHAELIRRSMAEHRLANRLHHVTDGEAALDYLQHRGPYAPPGAPNPPHVILLDLRLPRIDGLTVLATIKADPDLRAIPTVVLTTSEAEQDMVRAYDNHVNSYLVKPPDYVQFARLMRDLGNYWLGWNRSPPHGGGARHE